jgi:hypothetical protein
VFCGNTVLIDSDEQLALASKLKKEELQISIKADPQHLEQPKPEQPVTSQPAIPNLIPVCQPEKAKETEVKNRKRHFGRFVKEKKHSKPSHKGIGRPCPKCNKVLSSKTKLVAHLKAKYACPVGAGNDSLEDLCAESARYSA